MSAFLGKIHHLLYNKIQLNEEILEQVLKLAEEKNIPVEEIKNGIYKEYGHPETRVLEEVIENDNIHGWLQLKIGGVENRTAAIVTELINNCGMEIGEIAEIYFENGKKIMKDTGILNYSPTELFNLIFDNMLEGMPCDMINQVISGSENEFSWRTTRNIHVTFWTNVHGEASNFYILRDAWINGLLSGIGIKYYYDRTDDGYNKIVK